jgi:hypothetical protein
MNRPLIAATLAFGFTLAGASAVLAATQEFTITVPVTVKGLGTGTGGAAKVGITVSCAVGRGNLAYSTADGSATGANGLGSTHATVPANASGDVKVVVTDSPPADLATGQASGKGPSQYLCWGKLDQGTTPVNFISGNIVSK